jgi:hypothetical protein
MNATIARIRKSDHPLTARELALLLNVCGPGMVLRDGRKWTIVVLPIETPAHTPKIIFPIHYPFLKSPG